MLRTKVFIADNFAGKFVGRSYSEFSEEAIEFFSATKVFQKERTT
jgi:hypothetical protein